MNGEHVCVFTVEGCLFFPLKTMTLLKKAKKKKRLENERNHVSNQLYQKSFTLRNMVEKKCHWYSDFSRDWSHPHRQAANCSYRKIDYN